MIDPARTRARYDDSASYFVQSRHVRPSQLTVRSLNFGQPWRTPYIEDVHFVVTLPAAFFFDVVAAELPEYVADARQFPDGTDDFENALRAGGWPTPRAILEDSHLALMALEWLAHELLLAWFGDGEPIDSPGFILNTIDSAHFDRSNPRIEGSARTAGIPVVYQDV